MHKTLPSQFFNHETPKLFLFYFSSGREQVGEIRRRILRAPLGTKSQPAPEKPLGGGIWGGVKAKIWLPTEGEQGWAPTQESGATHRALSIRKLCSALRKFNFLIVDKGLCLVSQPFHSLLAPFILDVSRPQCHLSSRMAQARDSPKPSFLASKK